MTDRRRNLFILLLVFGLLAASVAVIATKSTRLGLDLKGGVELIYEAQPTRDAQVTPDALDRAIDIMRERVDQLGVAEPEIQRSGPNQIQVSLPDVTNAERAEQQVGQVAQLYFYDWEPNVLGPGGKPAPQDSQVTGGPQAGNPTWGLPLYEAVVRASKRPATNQDKATTGVRYYLLDDKNEEVLAGPEEKKEDLFSEGAKKEPGPGEKIYAVQPGTVIVRAEVPDQAKTKPDRWYVLNDAPALKGTDIKDPEQNFDNGPGGSGQPIVTFNFTDKGRNIWQDVTREIAQRGQANQVPGQDAQASAQHFAIVLDDELISVPFIDYRQNPDGIDGSNGSQIEGGFTIDSAQELTNLLKTGALPLKLELISQSQVSATLGQQALDEGLVAGLAGFTIVALFLLVFYRVLGVIAVGALLIYAVYFFALIKLIPITLTLPGIAGLILTLGVAADANIVIFERVKEEIRAGRSIPAGIAAGYKKGLAAIIDANVVTFMVAFILFILATAGVKGFAFTLGIGTLVSLFTAVLATQAVLGAVGHTRLMASPTALGAGEQKRRWTFDFMGASKWFFSMSGIILLIGALAIGGKGVNFGIDFESGTRITTALEQKANVDSVRSAIEGAGYGDAEIQQVSNKELGDNAFQISGDIAPSDVPKVQNALEDEFGGTPNFSNQSIGPTFGETVANSAIIAIIASLIVISVYIALRFEPKYAVPVVIALMHDLLIVAGVYALTGREVTTSTVAALLTIMGYSLYDTIIVFDRIRENVPRMPRAAFSQVVNRSLSEVLTRSLATSFSTLLPILALMLFGGETLRDFAFALAVGVLSGAYSSLFIATPVLTHWKEREPVYRARAQRIVDELGHIPAYATGLGGKPVDVAPKERKPQRAALTAPQDPTQVSRHEFDEMVREIEPEVATEQPEPQPTPDRGRGEDLAPEDLVMPRREDTPKPRKSRNKRHGRPR
jgi:SecD/SecF fusion protein